MKSKDNGQQNTSLKGKLENFWYYYKAPVIIGVIIIFLAGIFISDAARQVRTDLNISLVSAEPLSEGTISFNEALPGVIADVNGDGEANITISRLIIGEDLTEENAETYQHSLEAQLSSRTATLFIFDRINYDRMIRKDAYAPLDEYLDLSAYSDRVLYRNETPVAVHLAGSTVLAEMELLSDDLYALLLFKRPEDAENPEELGKYENAAAVLKALLQ